MLNRQLDAPIFMIGMPRSGTSIISEAISLNEELGFLSNYVHRLPGLPVLALLDRFTFLPHIGWRLRGKKRQFKGILNLVQQFLPYAGDGYRVWGRLWGEKQVKNYLAGKTADRLTVRRTKNYIQTILAYQDKSRFFTKLNGPPRICFLNSIFPEAFFIHILRDPRAVTASLLKSDWWIKGQGLTKPWWNGLPKQDMQQWLLADRSPIALSAIQWKQVVALTWKEKELIPPERYMEITYEDFIQSPFQCIRHIFLKAGLTPSITSHRYLEEKGKPVNMNYKFKQFFTRSEIELIDNLTRSTAMQAGYEY